MTLSRRNLLILTPALLTGCIGGGPPPRHFGLNAAGVKQDNGPTWLLAVAEPKSLQYLDSERIAVRPESLEFSYYAGADWIDRAPAMLQMLTIRSFQNRTRLQVTALGQSGPQPDFVLTGLLQDFQAERGGAHILLVASLARGSRRQIVQTKSFDVFSPASGAAIENMVDAFNRAFADLMDQLIAWTLQVAAQPT